MAIINLNNISLSFSTQRIFDSLDLVLHAGEKVGLVGPNGCGKTSLLKLIQGLIDPDTGDAAKAKSLKTGYLPQETPTGSQRTVLNELHAGTEEILSLYSHLLEASRQIESLSGQEQQRQLRRYEHLKNEFEVKGGYTFETRIQEITAGLGINQELLEKKMCELSGGQLSRIGLAKLLISENDLLLLDEPTNHLDFEAINWLESFLKKFTGAALIVSHDRYLLDNVVTKVADIDGKKAFMYTGNYSTYREEKQKRLLEQQRQYEKRKEFVDHTLDFIARNKDQEGMRKTARGRKKYLDRILHYNPDFLDKPQQASDINFSFDEKDVPKRKDVILSLHSLGHRYESVTLFENLNLELMRGQRLGIIGPNGTGKSSLLKIALGHLKPTDGSSKLKTSVTTGYLDQHSTVLASDNNVLEELASVTEDKTENLRSILGAFGFRGDEVFKSVSALSGGEKNRLIICKLVVSSPDLLILDEPTNHLDIQTTEALESALINYTGTLIIVSHDRYFLENVVDSILVIGADKLGRKQMGRFEFIPGPYSWYATILEKRRQSASQEKVSKPKQKKEKSKEPKTKTPSHLREFNKWTIEQIEEAIIETEEKIQTLHEKFGDDAIYKNTDLLDELREKLSKTEHYLEILYQAYELRS